LHLQFVPHIGIGNSKDGWACKSLIDEINNAGISIKGKLHELEIVSYENNFVKSIKKIQLN